MGIILGMGVTIQLTTISWILLQLFPNPSPSRKILRVSTPVSPSVWNLPELHYRTDSVTKPSGPRTCLFRLQCLSPPQSVPLDGEFLKDRAGPVSSVPRANFTSQLLCFTRPKVFLCGPQFSLPVLGQNSFPSSWTACGSALYMAHAFEHLICLEFAPTVTLNPLFPGPKAHRLPSTTLA